MTVFVTVPGNLVLLIATKFKKKMFVFEGAAAKFLVTWGGI
jgi:hypothetical protein